MSGHSKWSQIKRKKGVADQRRGQIFGMLAKMIAVELKRANGDRQAPNVRKAIERARAENLPNENIERAIQNATGVAATSLEEVTYEGYGPNGTALLIEGITDNKNRTSQEIKHLLGEHGANLAAPGSAAWAFRKSGGTWQAITPLELADHERERLIALVAALETHPDIKTVATNVAHLA